MSARLDPSHGLPHWCLAGTSPAGTSPTATSPVALDAGTDDGAEGRTGCGVEKGQFESALGGAAEEKEADTCGGAVGEADGRP